jgi:hypothetical protein
VLLAIIVGLFVLDRRERTDWHATVGAAGAVGAAFLAAALLVSSLWLGITGILLFAPSGL